MTEDHPADPRGLIREAYRIEGISASECRSVFVDWALSAPSGQAGRDALRMLVETYAEAAPDHPMSALLREGLSRHAEPRRRGGARARRD